MIFKNVILIYLGIVLLCIVGCGGSISSKDGPLLRLSLNTPLPTITSSNAAAYPVSGLCNSQKGDVTLIVGVLEGTQHSSSVNSQTNNNGEVTQTFSCSPVEEISEQAQESITPSAVDEIIDSITDSLNQNTNSTKGEFSGTINLITVTQNPPQIKLIQGTTTVTALLSDLPINDQVGPTSAPQITLSNTRSGSFIGGFNNGNPVTSHDLAVVCNEPEERLSLEGQGIDPSPQTYTCLSTQIEDNSQMEAETFTITLASDLETSPSNTLTLSSKDKYENPAQATTTVEMPVDTLGPRVQIESGNNIVQGQTASFAITVTDENLDSVNYTTTTSGVEVASYTCSTNPCNITTGSINTAGLLTLTILAESISDDLGNLGGEVDKNGSLTVLPAGTLAFNPFLTINKLNANSYTVSGQCDSRLGHVAVDVSGVSENIACNAIQEGLTGGGTFSGTLNVSSVTQNPPTITATQGLNIVNGPSVINDQISIANAPNILDQNPSGGNSKNLSIQCNEIGEFLTFSGTGLSPPTQTYTCSYAATHETVILTFENNIETSSSNSITVSSVDANENPTTNNSSFILPIDNQRPTVTVVAGSDIIQGDDAIFTVTVTDGSSFIPFTPYASQGTITSDQCSSSPCQVIVSGAITGNLNLIIYSGGVVDAAGNANLATITESLTIRASNLSINSPLPRATSLNASNYMISGNCESTQGNVTVTAGTPNVSELVTCSGGSYSARLDVTMVTLNPMTVSVSQQNENTIYPTLNPENDQEGPAQAPIATAHSGFVGGTSYNLAIVCNETKEVVQITGSGVHGLSPSIQTHICSNSGTENFSLTLDSDVETSNPNNLTISSKDEHGNPANSTTQVNVPIDTLSPRISITNSGEIATGNNATFEITVTDATAFTSFTPQVNSGTISSGACSTSPCTVTVTGANLGVLTLTILAGFVTDTVGNTNSVSMDSLNVIDSSLLDLVFNPLLTINTLNANNYVVSGQCDSRLGNVIVDISGASESVACNPVQNGSVGEGVFSEALDVSSVNENPPVITATQDVNVVNGPSIINDQTPIVMAPSILDQSPSNGNSESISVQCNEIGEILTFTGTGLNPSTQTYTCLNAFPFEEYFLLTFANNIETSSSNSITVSSVDAVGNFTTNDSSFVLPIDKIRPTVSVTAESDIIQGDEVVFTITITDGSSFTPFNPTISSGAIVSEPCSISPCQIRVSEANPGNLSLTVNQGVVIDAAGNTNLLTVTESLNVTSSFRQQFFYSRIAAGSTHTCIITRESQVMCWGVLDRLGDNQPAPIDDNGDVIIKKPYPEHYVVVVDENGVMSPLTGVISLAAGLDHTCALITTGQVRCWGGGGKLGDDTNLSFNHAVTVVDGNGSTNPLTGVISLAVGSTHTCALTTAGGVWCWGGGGRGQLGNDSITSSNHPVAVVDGDGSPNPLTNIVALDAGDKHTCAVTSGGGALCWGYGSHGQLGSSSETQNIPGEEDPVGFNRDAPLPVLVGEGGSPLSGVLEISGGVVHTCALLEDSGVKCWGSEYSGRLGNGENTYGRQYYPVDVLVTSGGALFTGATEMKTFSEGACVIMESEEELQCWGDNDTGELGLGHGPVGNHSATPIGTLTGQGSFETLKSVRELAKGQGSTNCALPSKGGILCWGANSHGQLGDTTLTDRRTPVLVVDGVNSTGFFNNYNVFRRTYSCEQGANTSSCGHDPVDQILLALASPSSTPSTSASISIEVSGLTVGDSLSIYNSKDCSGTAVATTSSNSSVTVNGLSEGAHVFHFKITASNSSVSSCSKSFLSYHYDATDPTAVTLSLPSTSGTNAIPGR